MDLVAANILSWLDEAEKNRLELMKRQWSYYQGDPPKPLKVQYGSPDDNVRLDLPREIVDTGVAFLFGEDLGISVPEDQSEETQTWLDDALLNVAPGGSGLLWQRLAVNGGVTGHAHCKLQPRKDGGWRVVVLDPSFVTADWSEDDVEDVYRWRITWTTIHNQTPAVRRQTIERADTGQSWTITDEVSVSGSAVWLLLGRSAWPFPFSPIVACQNLPQPNEYYGLSDLEPSILDMCDTLNRVSSHIAKIVRVHGFPKPWAKGMGTSQLEVVDMGMETIALLPSADAELGYLESKGDIGASLEFYDRMKVALLEQTRIPEVATGKLASTGQLSGRALKIMYGPLIDKTEAKRRTYGTLVEEVCSRLLVLGGKAQKVEDARCMIQWPDLVPSDPKEEAETLEMHKTLGVVSKQTIADKLGYDYDEERQRIEDEGATELDNPAADVLPGMPGEAMMVQGAQAKPARD